jgi:hypothetical protein
MRELEWLHGEEEEEEEAAEKEKAWTKLLMSCYLFRPIVNYKLFSLFPSLFNPIDLTSYSNEHLHQ